MVYICITLLQKHIEISHYKIFEYWSLIFFFQSYVRDGFHFINID